MRCPAVSVVEPHGVNTKFVEPHGVNTKFVEPHGVNTKSVDPHGFNTKFVEPYQALFARLGRAMNTSRPNFAKNLIKPMQN